jgi:hypothetical protein
MSDISIKNSVVSINTTSSSGASNTASTPSSSKTTNTVHADTTTDVVSEEFGKVVSVSEDGDTVRVKNDNQDEGIHDILQQELDELKEDELKEDDFKTPDFNVHKIEPPEIKPIEIEAKDDTINVDTTSYIGYTDAELKEMYLEGVISQTELNHELEVREANRKAQAADDSKFVDVMADKLAKVSDIERSSEAVNTIENKDTSSTLSDEARVQALQNFDTV